MRQIIIISILLTLFTKQGISQVVSDSLLLRLERQYYVSTDSLERNECLLKKVNAYIDAGQYDEHLFAEINRVDWQLISEDPARKNFLWNAALSGFLVKKYHQAANYMEHYKELVPGDSANASAVLLDLLIHLDIDSAYIHSGINRSLAIDSNFRTLTCYAEVAGYSKKHRAFYLVSSVLVPGSGSMMLGKARQGTVSLILNAGTAYAIYALIQNNLYINAVTWGVALVQKFYFGNIRLTDTLFEKAESKHQAALAGNCEKQVQALLLSHPLLFR